MASESLRRQLSFISNALTLGKRPQSFLAARWVEGILRACPRAQRRSFALQLLGLSPHYFFRESDPAYRGMPRRKFLEMEARRNDESRRILVERIVAPHLPRGRTALDLGCGPGFAARHASGFASRVFACDISPGVIACAKILNPAANIIYFDTLDDDYQRVPDASLDLVYSFAVAQHVTDRVLRGLLSTCFAKLKPGGRAVFHMVTHDPTWRSERDWRSDRSIRGRIKVKYALNCFVRNPSDVRCMVVDAGFDDPEFHLASEFVSDLKDAIADQDIVLFGKPT